MGIGKRLWDMARANANDFASELFTGGEGLSAKEKAELEAEFEESVGSKAGRQVRGFRDKAEDAWERAFEASQARGGGSTESPLKTRERWHRTLELEPGASFEEIRRAYRKLMAKYHPDRFASDPAKFEAATEVARKITEAYEGLKRHHQG